MPSVELSHSSGRTLTRMQLRPEDLGADRVRSRSEPIEKAERSPPQLVLTLGFLLGAGLFFSLVWLFLPDWLLGVIVVATASAPLDLLILYFMLKSRAERSRTK